MLDGWTFDTLRYAQLPEWRNWQTRRIQNPVELKLLVGSIPTSGIHGACARH